MHSLVLKPHAIHEATAAAVRCLSIIINVITIVELTAAFFSQVIYCVYKAIRSLSIIINIITLVEFKAAFLLAFGLLFIIMIVSHVSNSFISVTAFIIR